jgi:putative phosphoribosyl transferase
LSRLPTIKSVGALSSVTAPTLLIVGSLDNVVIDLNKVAMAEMNCEVNLEIVAGASHLFEEPGKLETVSELAADWFTSHMPGLC